MNANNLVATSLPQVSAWTAISVYRPHFHLQLHPYPYPYRCLQALRIRLHHSTPRLPRQIMTLHQPVLLRHLRKSRWFQSLWVFLWCCHFHSWTSFNLCSKAGVILCGAVVVGLNCFLFRKGDPDDLDRVESTSFLYMRGKTHVAVGHLSRSSRDLLKPDRLDGWEVEGDLHNRRISPGTLVPFLPPYLLWLIQKEYAEFVRIFRQHEGDKLMKLDAIVRVTRVHNSTLMTNFVNGIKNLSERFFALFK